MTSQRIVRALPLLLAGAAVLASCSDDPADDDPADPVETVDGVEGTTVETSTPSTGLVSIDGPATVDPEFGGADVDSDGG